MNRIFLYLTCLTMLSAQGTTKLIKAIEIRNRVFFKKPGDLRDIETIKELIANGADVNERDRDQNTPLMVAASCGDLETVQELIKNSAEVNIRVPIGPWYKIEEWSALTYAARRGENNKEVVDALLAANAEFDIQNNTDLKTLENVRNQEVLHYTPLSKRSSVCLQKRSDEIHRKCMSALGYDA